MRKNVIIIMMTLLMTLMVCSIAAVARPVPVQASTSSALKKKTQKIIKKKTTSKDSKKAKMQKLFQELEKKSYGYKRTIGFKADKAWGQKYALDFLKAKKGSCYGYAAAYGYLVKQATGYKVRLAVGKTNGFSGELQDHAWTEVKIKGKWYIFDVNMDKYAENNSLKYFYVKRDSLKKTYNNYKKVTYTTVKF